MTSIKLIPHLKTRIKNHPHPRTSTKHLPNLTISTKVYQGPLCHKISRLFLVPVVKNKHHFSILSPSSPLILYRLTTPTRHSTLLSQTHTTVNTRNTVSLPMVIKQANNKGFASKKEYKNKTKKT